MKFVYAFLSLIVITTLLVSCDPATCDTVDCGPYKECVGGDCVCPQGLEGDQCQIYSYEKYIGSYQVSENCTSTTFPQNPPYNVNISTTSLNDRILLNNFASLGLAVEAVINGVYLSIPEQTVGSYTVEGSGEYNAATNRITIQYNLTSGSNYSGCTVVYTKF